MSISVKIDTVDWDKTVTRIEKNIHPAQLTKILKRNAWQALQQLTHMVKSKKGTGTGETSLGWKVIELGKDRYEVVNTSKAALFLEEGTKPHGPTKSKYLYIPLKKGIKTWRKGQIFGKDYILAKKVKGIKARKYLRPTSVKVQRRLKLDMIQELHKIGK